MQFDKVDNYKRLLSKFYFFYRADAEAMLSDNHVKPAYQVSCREKSIIFASKDWSNLIADLRSNPFIDRVRDLSYDTPHCLKVLFSLKSDHGYGIGVCLTLTGYFLGFYYMSEKLIENERCFGLENGYYLSYDPIIDSQISMAKSICGVVKEKLSQFQLFDQNLADYSIEHIQGQTYYFDRIDLF